jgi:chemotaxis protein methyltransferase CheR
MTIDKKTYDAICDMVYDRMGITLKDKEALVTARIGKRLRALNLDSFKDYLAFLNSGTNESEVEFTEFMNVMTTNLTYFFREPDHFTFMAEIVQDMVAAGQNKVRIWCAASSTGEEPYTIAMTFLENAAKFRGDCRILATDIDTNILNTAWKGQYAEGRMKDVNPQLRLRYFNAAGTGANKVYTVKDEVKNMITFGQVNLSKPPFPMKGPFDIIFCRNVMIYFDNTVRGRLMKEFERLLRPGGYLMIGHSESMAGTLCDLRTVRPSVYIKD